MGTYPEPEFLPPYPHGFVYAGYRAARERDAAEGWLRSLARELAERQEVVSISLFRAVLRPPIPGSPHHDLLLLARTTSPGTAEGVMEVIDGRDPRPAMVFTATNALRVGDTEADPTGTFLFNHFAGRGDGAVDAWRGLTGWYTVKTGVDNSTLLVPDSPAPFAVVNYVRLPRGAVGSMLDQLRRPSFHTFVRRRLSEHGLRAMPVFYTRR
jgi:hypothetical protein